MNRGNLPPALGASSLEAASIASVSACKWARVRRLFGNLLRLRKLDFIADHLLAQALSIKKLLPHRHIQITFCGDNVFIKLLIYVSSKQQEAERG